MAKEKMVLFRTSLAGFNREDVNTYIEKQNAEFAERERVTKKRLDAAEAKCNELESKVQEFVAAQTRIAELEKEAETRERLIAEYIEKVECQAVEIENLAASKSSAEGEITKLTEEIASLSEAISKSEKYDDISNQIGEIILSARSTADGILAKANEEAAMRLAAADEKIENAAAGFNTRAENATNAIKMHMTKLANDSYASLAVKAAETSDMLRNLASHISSSAENFGNEIAARKSDAETAIAEEASKIFSNENRISFKK